MIIRPSQTAAFPTFAANRKEVLNLSSQEDIHLVILQSLGDTTFFKRALQTEDIHLVILQSLGDTTFFKRAIEPNGFQVPPFNLSVNFGNDNFIL